MYVNVVGPFSLTLIGIRKTHFREFSGVAASLFNLRQQRSELSSLRAAALAGRFVRGIQLSEQITLFSHEGFFFFPDQLTEGQIEARNNKNYSKQIKFLKTVFK